MKKRVAKVLKKALKKLDIDMSEQELESKIEIPPNYDLGDYSFPCFSIAQKLSTAPHEIALKIRSKIGNIPFMYFQEILTNGPYVNFYINRKSLARKVVWEIISKKQKYGTRKNPFYKKSKKIVVEFSSPNIAKPFGVGHLRSTIIGNSIANLAETQGYKIKKINYLGDWGTQFGKIIYAYKKWGKLEKLNKNPIKYLEKLYVRINKNKKYEEPSRDWFKKLEQGDKEAVTLWRAFRELSLEEFEKIYKELNIKFDDYLGESMYEEKMKEVVQELKEKKLLKKSKGALVVDLTKYDLGVALIQKTDGTTLYITRDLASAIDRHKKHNFDLMVYEVGQEQTLHFKQVFKILELMGYEWAKDCIHVSHGLYLDKDGKKFSTRKGKTFYIEDLLSQTKNLAAKEIKKRIKNLSKEELDERAHKVAIAAIFYGDLKNNRNNNIIFDLNKFVSFEGDTGPYIQYSYARASSILRKTKNNEKFKTQELEDKEIHLIKKLDEYPQILAKSFELLSPSLIANYAFQLSQIFNEFYHECPVIGDEKESFRLALVESFRQVIRNALGILGIKVLEEM